MRRPNLAAQAPHLENARRIAATGFQFVLIFGGRDRDLNEEASMNTLAGEINTQINAGRKVIEHAFGELKDIDTRKVPPPALVAAGFATALVAVGIVGWMVYRSRRRRTLVERLQSALPDSVRDLPQGIRAQVTRAL
jgi:hypothetical protein